MQTSELDDNPDITRIARVIPQHHTLVAIEEGAIVGFVDAFMTVSKGGARRFEVDLLGVLPACQGRGIARQLVAEAVEQSTQPDVRQVRALIRESNVPSQRCFAACGFERSDIPLRLFAADAQAGMETNVHVPAHFVVVETLTYSGIWLEGELSAAAFGQARALLHRNEWQVAGTLIPSSDADTQLLAEKAGFERVGEYRWWTLNRALA